MKLKELVILHRHGIMGTVIFHLLIAILFMSMQISRVRVHTEIEIQMDVPEKEEIQKQELEKQRQEEIRQKTSEEEVERMLRSIAVNENITAQNKQTADASVEDYVNEILDELREAGDDGRYQVKRDKHYKQDSLQRVRDLREQELDSLKSTFYSGESSVSYNLKGRYARILPIPVFKCESGGRVVVEVIVNPRGVVIKADVIKGQSAPDERLWRVAEDAANRSRFNDKADAPAQQKGTITYNFVKQ